MAIRPSNAAVHDILRAFPSVLAMRDLQPAVSGVLAAANAEPPELAAVLQLDPLAALRALRTAHAPVFRRSAALPTVPQLVGALGHANTRRLFECPAVEVADDSPLRTQWRHSVATALAARDLARKTGLLDADAAYLLGLVCDTPRWLALIQAHGGRPITPWSADSTAHWQLPTAVVAQFQISYQEDDLVDDVLPTDVTTLLRVARRQASQAGFHAAPHPAAPARAVRKGADDPPDAATREHLQQAFADALRAANLDAVDPAATPPPAPPPGRAVQRVGGLDQLVLSVLGCQSPTYLGIVTVLTAAALRFGDYDRVFYAKWNQQTGVLVLRCKADGSSRRVAVPRLQASVSEAHTLQTAVAEGRPVLLQAALRNTTGLLAALSTDELLAVPLNASFLQPSFLLLDRSLTQKSIQLEAELPRVQALSRAGSLLIENLLLRQRARRAEKFALTDPLTRLFNRRMGLLTLEHEIARSDRSSRPLTVLMADLDHFKQLNDTLGHLQGDQALRATADVMRLAMRRGDTVCRYGGEEFLLVLSDTTADEATVVAARLFTAVQRRGEELGLPITVSIGLTTYRPGDTIESILQRADHALYASKGHGRNRFSADVEQLDDVAPNHPNAT